MDTAPRGASVTDAPEEADPSRPRRRPRRPRFGGFDRAGSPSRVLPLPPDHPVIIIATPHEWPPGDTATE
jgi:hypothetical protein